MGLAQELAFIAVYIQHGWWHGVAYVPQVSDDKFEALAFMTWGFWRVYQLFKGILAGQSTVQFVK